MRKMTEADVNHIVQLLKKWKRRPLFWDDVRHQISIDLFAGEQPWSRQSLQANETIETAWKKAHKRLRARTSDEGRLDDDAKKSEAERLRAEFDDLKRKYENLLLKHRQLVYNTSMLPGGTRLLLDPLPDNTAVQRWSNERKASKKPSR